MMCCNGEEQNTVREKIKAINKSFAECKLILGDFNLSPKITNDKKKIETL